MRLLHSTSGWCALSSCLGGKLFAGSFSSGRFASGLLGTSHHYKFSQLCSQQKIIQNSVFQVLYFARLPLIGLINSGSHWLEPRFVGNYAKLRVRSAFVPSSANQASFTNFPINFLQNINQTLKHFISKILFIRGRNFDCKHSPQTTTFFIYEARKHLAFRKSLILRIEISKKFFFLTSQREQSPDFWFETDQSKVIYVLSDVRTSRPNKNAIFHLLL